MNMAPDIEAFVEEQIEKGIFRSREDLFEAALRGLRDRMAEERRIAALLRPGLTRAATGYPGRELDAEDLIRRARAARTSQADT